MTLPGKRSALLPTSRELKYLATFLLGGWVFLGVRELLSHLPSRPSDADRWAATARDAGVLPLTPSDLSRMSVEANARNNGPRAEIRHAAVYCGPESWRRAT